MDSIQQFGACLDQSSQCLGYGASDVARVGGKGAFLRGRRHRMNVVPMIICFVLPSALFAAVYALSCFSLRYESPMLTFALVLISLLIVLVFVFYAFEQRFQRGRNAPAEREPSWMCFMALSLILAWALAVVLGTTVYRQHFKPYFDAQNLNTYTDVYPNRIRGQQIMDAGSVMFAKGTTLDVARSMGFKNMGMYCVAPISFGSEKMPTYDFWAVGMNCCSGTQPDFHCHGFNNPNARGGLRLMTDGDRPFYRMAVQEAEATYNIKAVHPLFFYWVEDTTATTEDWKRTGYQFYTYSCFGYLLFQAFLVVVAAIAFSKLG